MAVSVVIPLFNKRAYIPEAIASLAMQECPPEELIVVDDASTDGGVEAVKCALEQHADSFRRTHVELIRFSRNQGPGAARNAGIDRTRAELIFCLDADDCLRCDALQLIREAMANHDLALTVIGFVSEPPGEKFPDLGALGSDMQRVADDVFLPTDPLRMAAHPEFFMGRASNVAVRRSWLGGQRYRADVRLNEGVDLWYRVLKDIVAGGARIGVIAVPLIRFRILADSLSHRRYDNWRLLEVPPTVSHFVGSSDPRDRRMAARLAERWLMHAMSTVPRAQKTQFIEHHRALLTQLDLSTPLRELVANHDRR